eukprot:9073937-Karenia_brevis.AAC.1
MHLWEMGWQAQWSTGSLLLKDHEGDVWKPNPEYGMGLLRSMLEDRRIQLPWAQASMHRHGLDLAVTSKHYN